MWQLYGTTTTFGAYQLFKEEEAGTTIGAPTKGEGTGGNTFYIDIVNGTVSTTVSFRVATFFASSAPVTITSSIL